jgi:hypothetical protein
MTDNLTQQLAERAEDFARRGGTELHIDQVLARAGEIKRGRRMRATILMAACVLAIAVPSVLVAANQDGTHEPSPAPATKVDTGPLTLQGLKAGDAPRSGWFQGNVWHGPDGREFELSGGRVLSVVTIGDDTLIATADAQGQTARLVPPVTRSAQQVQTWPMEGGFARSADGTVAAFVKPDGTPVVVADSGRTTYSTPKIPNGSGFDAVAITGDNCARSGTTDCTVWVNTRGLRPAAWLSYAGGLAQRFDTDLRGVADLSADRHMIGTLSVSDNGSCSALETLGGRFRWQTCDHTLLSFSPDAQHLLATSAYRDGAGDSEVAVLDSSTGKSLLDLRTADGAFVTQLVWEDDTHVLANLHDGGDWAVVRIGLDGKREYAVPPTPGPDYDGSPFVLPTR